jgi:hypothetical protein
VQVQDIERGIVLVIGDVDPNILVKKLKNINKNAEICGSMYNILAHNEESSRSNLPGNRSGQRGGRGFLCWLFGKKSNRSNNEDDIDIHNYPSSDNNGNGNSVSETLELHSNTSDDHEISHHHGNDNTGNGSGVGQTIPTGDYYNPMNNQEYPFMYPYGQGMQMQPPWPAMNQQHQQQEEAYNSQEYSSFSSFFGVHPNYYDQYMKMLQQQQQQQGNQQQQDAYNNMNRTDQPTMTYGEPSSSTNYPTPPPMQYDRMYPPTMMYGEPSSSMNYTTPPPMQHDSNLVDPKPVYNDGYVDNWWTT